MIYPSIGRKNNGYRIMRHMLPAILSKDLKDVMHLKFNNRKEWHANLSLRPPWVQNFITSAGHKSKSTKITNRQTLSRFILKTSTIMKKFFPHKDNLRNV